MRKISGKFDRQLLHNIEFFQLALKGSPNVLELLFAPVACVVTTTPLWERITSSRDVFLSRRLFDAYRGFATSQDKQARIKPDGSFNRKHASHCIRLLAQGVALAQNGNLPVRLEGGVRELCLGIKVGDVPYDLFCSEASRLRAQLELAFMESGLPEEPDLDVAEALLLDVAAQANATQLHNRLCTGACVVL